MTITLPNNSQAAGIPSQWSDTITAAVNGLITGNVPPVLTQDLLFEASQTIAALTPVGFNGNKRLVAATDDVASAVKASGLLTFSGVGTADDTVTIGAVTYTLKAAPTTVANEVLIGASAAATANNLIAAINGAAGGGTTYGSLTTEHPTVNARLSASGVVEVVAKTAGTAGNAIATTESGTGASFGAATLTGGKEGLGVQAIGITVAAVTTTASTDYKGAPVYRGGCFNPDMLTWPAAFDTDAKKFAAFEGAPSPTSIVLRRPAQHDI